MRKNDKNENKMVRFKDFYSEQARSSLAQNFKHYYKKNKKILKKKKFFFLKFYKCLQGQPKYLAIGQRTMTCKKVDLAGTY